MVEMVEIRVLAAALATFKGRLRDAIFLAIRTIGAHAFSAASSVSEWVYCGAVSDCIGGGNE
jgi:hypothetical protein